MLGGTSQVAWVRAAAARPPGCQRAFPCTPAPAPLPPASQGIVTILPYRGDHMDTRHLQRMGDLGVAVPLPFSPRDEDSIRRATENSDIVINLIGKVRRARLR